MTEPAHRRRDRQDITMEILKTAKDREKKTHIMYKAGTSYSQIEKYPRVLNDAVFITCMRYLEDN